MTTFDFTNILLLVGFFLFVGVIVNRPSQRYGIPALVLYIFIGFIFGNGGKYDFLFDFPVYVSLYSQIAIGFIVFIGGFATPLKKIKVAWKDGLALSTLGVFLTTILLAIFTSFVFGQDWMTGLMIGAVLSATDAAAVFSILEAKKIKLKENISEILEVESSTNDPVAYFLTVTLTALAVSGQGFQLSLFGDLLINFIGGTLLGAVIGFAIVKTLKKIQLEVKGLYAIILLAAIFIILGASPHIQANSLMALYVAGVIIGNFYQEAKLGAGEFFEGLSWLMQISLFIVLGLQADPSRLLNNMGLSLSIMLFLILVARPLAVFLIYAPTRASRQKKILISWVGLRGATPIAFALIPLTFNHPSGDLFFDVAFIVVCFSVLIQGSTLEWFAKRLKLVLN